MHNNTDKNMVFLKEKIKEIKNALFSSDVSFESQLPNNIIETLTVEDDGSILFFTTCSANYNHFFKRPFYATLNYYKKGTNCRLQLSGNAIIMESEDDALFSTDDCSRGAHGTVLVKLKMLKAEFFETKTVTNISWTEKLKNVISHLFVAPPHRIFNFSS